MPRFDDVIKTNSGDDVASAIANDNAKKMEWINSTLNALYKKLNQYYPKQKQAHKDSQKPYDVAHTLIAELRTANVVFTVGLSFTNNRSETQKIETDFLNACKTAIDKAKPILQKDHNLGDYLTNLLKSLANLVVKVVSSNPQVFFKPKETTAAAAAIAEVDQKLHPAVAG